MSLVTLARRGGWKQILEVEILEQSTIKGSLIHLAPK